MLRGGVEPKSICVLTPCSAEYAQLRKVVTALQDPFSDLDLRAVSLAKIDGFQG